MLNALEFENPNIWSSNLIFPMGTTLNLVNFISDKSKKSRTLKYVTAVCLCLKSHVPPSLHHVHDDVGKMLCHHFSHRSK